MLKNDPKRSKMLPNAPKVVPNKSKWSKMVKNGQQISKNNPCGGTYKYLEINYICSGESFKPAI